jgi:hypothetical protein
MPRRASRADVRRKARAHESELRAPSRKILKF